ncbi:MAG TPA: helix-turn-helix domain-containing protein [Methanolinea sp.]|nr:helix-turn-helix domain-containing protein [Methanolinea sp.]
MSARDCDIMVCDTMVRRFLPAMRAEMVFRLIQQQGLSQSEAAKRLGITRAAVSQYISRKRGDATFELSADMNALIDRWVQAVAGREDGITLCDICQCAMKDGGPREGSEFSHDCEGSPGVFHPSSGTRRGEEGQQ